MTDSSTSSILVNVMEKHISFPPHCTVLEISQGEGFHWLVLGGKK